MTFKVKRNHSVGRLAVAEDSTSGRIEFTYDALDRLVQELTTQGVVEYAYDALGRRATITANGQQPVSYQYDAASRLTQVAQGTLAVGLGYDAAGRRTSLTYPNGTNTSYSYDNASRLLSIVHDGPAGLIESLTYTYDASGNRTSLARANAAASLLPDPVQAAYDAANQQIQFGNPLPTTPNLTYDANGNLTSQADASGTTTYSWDARDRLFGISGPGLSASFEYDARARRSSKTITGVTTKYLYIGNEPVAEIQDGALVASYMTFPGRVDERLIRRIAQGSEIYYTDAIHSVVAIGDNAGDITTTYSYGPFGTTTSIGPSSNPFQFTGRENDDTGLYYYRARYYMPLHQRFMSEDPTRLRGGFNFYEYVGNNPTRFIDPFGLDKTPPNPCLIAVSTLKGDILITVPCGPDNKPPTNIIPEPECDVDIIGCYTPCVAKRCAQGARACIGLCRLGVPALCKGCLTITCGASIAKGCFDECRVCRC